MPEIINPFETSDAFSMASLTQAINILPNNYGRCREMNLFPGKGVRTRTIIVEEKNGILNLLPTRPVGAPGTQNKMGKRTVRSFTVPHIPVDDVILPDEYSGVRSFGSDNQMATLSEIMNDHLATLKDKFAITIEHLRMGALKGVILDSDGSTLYNLFTEFGITKKTVDFALTTSTTKVRSKCLAVSRHIEDNLKGEIMDHVHVLCSEGFFESLIEHDEVAKAYLYHSQAVDALGGDPRKGFKFGGLTFEEYRGTATDLAGNPRDFITANYAIAFPVGTRQTFRTFYAPADFLETANTIGIELYAKQEARKFNRGVDVHAQSNPLPLCMRPGVLVELKKNT